MRAIMLATGMADTVAGVAEEGVDEVAVVAVAAPRKENREQRHLARVKQPSLLKVILLHLLPQRLVEITVAVDSEDGEGTVVVDAAFTEPRLQP
jgi:ribonuclease PH